MSYFTGSYLRVLSPKTSDGITLKYDKKGQVMYDEQHVAITARKILERKNQKLPPHLKKIIEEVNPETKTVKSKAVAP